MSNITSPGGEQGGLPYDVVAWEVTKKTGNMKSMAWLLWFLLGGIGAHLAYIYPRNRALILVVSIVALIVTFGISGIVQWLLSWIALASDSSYDQYRDHIRREVEGDMLRRRSLYGDA